jgi:hypothetical protein
MSLKRVGRAQNSRFGSTMHARGVSSVWESAGFASRRSPVRSRYAPLRKALATGLFVFHLVDKTMWLQAVLQAARYESPLLGGGAAMERLSTAATSASAARHAATACSSAGRASRYRSI